MLAIRLLLIVCGLLIQVPAHAETRDQGGLALGIEVVQKHEFGLEADGLYKLSRESDGGSFLLSRLSVGYHVFQDTDSGPDFYLEPAVCYGLYWHACAGVGFRQQNRAVRYLQSTIEVGSAFLLSAFVRPLLRVSADEPIPPGFRSAKTEVEFGIKFKYPIWTF